MHYPEDLFSNEYDAEKADAVQALLLQARSLAAVFEDLHGVPGAEGRADRIADDIAFCEAALKDLGVPCPH